MRMSQDRRSEYHYHQHKLENGEAGGDRLMIFSIVAFLFGTILYLVWRFV